MGQAEPQLVEQQAQVSAGTIIEELKQRVQAPKIEVLFADDSYQTKPTRQGLGPLVAIGGFSIPAELVGDVSRLIDDACNTAGFPTGEPLKWSPRRGSWMRDHLLGDDRVRLFSEVLEVLKNHQAAASVIIADANAEPATGASTPEADVTTMLLERVDLQCRRRSSQCFVVVDRPSGGRSDEEAFLSDCLETIQTGTTYVKPERILHNVLSAPSRLSCPLQAADLIVSSTLAVVAGETRFAPEVFKMIKPILDHDGSRIAGFGLKLHPDHRLANLYHWLLGELCFWKANTGLPMPLSSRPYATDPLVP